LFEDAVQRSRREVVARFSSDGHAPWLYGVLKLAMTASSCHQQPAVLAQKLKYLADFHG